MRSLSAVVFCSCALAFICKCTSLPILTSISQQILDLLKSDNCSLPMNDVKYFTSNVGFKVDVDSDHLDNGPLQCSSLSHPNSGDFQIVYCQILLLFMRRLCSVYNAHNQTPHLNSTVGDTQDMCLSAASLLLNLRPANGTRSSEVFVQKCVQKCQPGNGAYRDFCQSLMFIGAVVKQHQPLTTTVPSGGVVDVAGPAAKSNHTPATVFSAAGAGTGSAGVAPGSAAGVRNGSAAGVRTGSAAGVRTGSAAGVRTGSAAGVRTGSAAGVRTGSAAGVRTGSAAGVRTGSAAGVRTGSAAGVAPGSAAGVAPGSARVGTGAGSQTTTQRVNESHVGNTSSSSSATADNNTVGVNVAPSVGQSVITASPVNKHKNITASSPAHNHTDSQPSALTHAASQSTPPLNTTSRSTHTVHSTDSAVSADNKTVTAPEPTHTATAAHDNVHNDLHESKHNNDRSQWDSVDSRHEDHHNTQQVHSNHEAVQSPPVEWTVGERAPPAAQPPDNGTPFFSYFVTLVVVCIIFFLVMHNKNKIMGLMIEGRRRDSRRRTRGSSYTRLNSEEPAPISHQTRQEVTKNIIY